VKTAWWVRLAVAVALACRLGAAGAEDLLEVVAQARAADPLRAGADAQRGAQREAAAQARAALLPQWQLSAAGTRAQQQGGASRQVDSSLTQVLVDVNRQRTWGAERTLTIAQDARVRAAEQDLAARVARAYFGVLSALATQATAQANEDAFAAQVAQAQQRFDAGLSAQIDVEQGRAYHALARGTTVQARQALADARQALAQITGRMPGPLQALAADLPELPLQPAEPQAWVDRALQSNPALQAQALALEASQQRIEAARAAHWPTLSAGLDTQHRDGAGVPDSERGHSITQVALRLAVPLFTGGAIDSQVRQAAYQRDAAREDVLAVRRALVRETQAQHEAVVSGLALMQSTRAAVAAADRALAATRTGQALGTRSNTDLLLAIQTQAAAQNAHQQARHAYVLAWLLLQATGGLGEAELATVNRLLVAPAGAAQSTLTQGHS